MPLNLLLLHKSFLTLGRNYAADSTPISMPGWKSSRMPPECSTSEAVVGTSSTVSQATLNKYQKKRAIFI